MKQDELVPLTIDLEKLKSNQLDESFLAMWGSWIQTFLKRMFDLQSLATVLGREKRYMESFLKYGLNDTRVLNSRHKLETAVYNFERDTGIKWPLK